MAKVKIVITHEEYGEFDLGDVPERMFAEYLNRESTNWSLSDMGADWRRVKVEINDKEYPVEQ